MKAIIIDDERLARDELRDLLRAHPEIEIIGEAAHNNEARTLIYQKRPDVIFLDIQMPGADGFTLLESLPPPIPLVVFITAHSQHAPQAFRVNAVDYLLKPVDPNELQTTIRRLIEKITYLQTTHSADPNKERRLNQEDTIFVRDGDRCWFVPVKKIRLAECVGNYCRIHFDTHHPLILSSLSAFADRLDPRLFICTSRSKIINIQHITSTSINADGVITAKLTDGNIVTFSRRAATLFRRTHCLKPTSGQDSPHQHSHQGQTHELQRLSTKQLGGPNNRII